MAIDAFADGTRDLELQQTLKLTWKNTIKCIRAKQEVKKSTLRGFLRAWQASGGSYAENSQDGQLILGPQPALSGNNELPAITAVPAVDYFTPEVYWSQTETTVALSIKLIDCQDYNISLKMRNMFNFSATQGEKTYSLKLMFFDYVHKMEHMSTGPEVRVTLTKFNNVDWPRLTMSKQKARNIHYDINKVSIDDDDDKPKKILEFPKEFDEMLDDLNENDPMYMEYSDLDSDMDLEIENESD